MNELLQNQGQKFVTKLSFRSEQLIAIKTIFGKYIAPVCNDFQYIGHAIALTWHEFDTSKPEIEKNNGAWLPGEKINGYNFNLMKEDPLWQRFSDILPYMSRSASLTIMPPMSMMPPHIDRPTRPPAVYFPISDPDYNCISDFYDMPRNEDPNVRNSTQEVIIPTFSYRMMNDAMLMNPQEWHGVRSYSAKTRIVLGWNTAEASAGQEQKTYAELVEIFSKLGYC